MDSLVIVRRISGCFIWKHILYYITKILHLILQFLHLTVMGTDPSGFKEESITSPISEPYSKRIFPQPEQRKRLDCPLFQEVKKTVITRPSFTDASFVS